MVKRAKVDDLVLVPIVLWTLIGRRELDAVVRMDVPDTIRYLCGTLDP